MEEIRTHTILHNRYEIQRELGRGGMGAVYLAQDLRHRKPVAIKLARLASPEARAQFQREAAYLQKLHHHSLPRVWDTFSDTQRDFLVMEYIPGDDLETRVRRQGPLPEWLALRWADELLDGLAYLHSQQPPIIHRDIKPGNLKLRQDDTLVLVDFGIAKEYLPGVDTIPGADAVTPGFSPLEQYSDALTDARSDLYSVGATMYFLLTGVAPPPAPDRASGDQKLLSPSQLVPSISTGSESAMRKALSLARDQRWASAAEMRQAFDQAAQRLTTQPLSETGPQARQKLAAKPRPPARRAGMAPLLLGLLAAAAGVAAIVLFLLTPSDSAQPGAAAPPPVVVTATYTRTVAAAPESSTPAATAGSAAAGQQASAATAMPVVAPATLAPTSTPIPTRTPEGLAPTATPTFTARPAPGAAAAPTATAAGAAAAPTATAAGRSISVALQEPNDGDTRSEDVTFRWSVTGGSLAAGQALEVFFYTTGQDPLRDGFGIAAPTTGDRVQVNLAGLDADPGLPLEPGQYWWAVRLIDQATGRAVSLVSDGRRVTYQRPSQPQPAAPTDTPAAAPTDPPAPPPVSRSFVPAADANDLGSASQGGALGVGLFFALIGLASWRQRRRS